jgi:hypothetical protein
LQLNLVGAGAIEQILVGRPRVGADVLDVSYAIRVLLPVIPVVGPLLSSTQDWS